MAEVHDCFTPTELVLMEDLGFAERGTAWKEVLAGTFDLDGELAVNPDGGLKSFGHPIGASGLRMLFECWLQLRGEAGKRQIASIDARPQARAHAQPRRRAGRVRVVRQRGGLGAERVGRRSWRAPQSSTRSTPRARRGSAAHRRSRGTVPLSRSISGTDTPCRQPQRSRGGSRRPGHGKRPAPARQEAGSPHFARAAGALVGPPSKIRYFLAIFGRPAPRRPPPPGPEPVQDKGALAPGVDHLGLSPWVLRTLQSPRACGASAARGPRRSSTTRRGPVTLPRCASCQRPRGWCWG